MITTLDGPEAILSMSRPGVLPGIVVYFPLSNSQVYGAHVVILTVKRLGRVEAETKLCGLSRPKTVSASLRQGLYAIFPYYLTPAWSTPRKR